MGHPDFVLIMAGGAGARFWPLSNKEYPKQFLDIMGTGQTLLQQTYNRFCKTVSPENIYVITFDDYMDIVEQQLPELPKQNIIGEPSRKNTACCIAYACFKLSKKNPEGTILVTPSDHQILNEDEFQRVCEKGIEFIQRHDALITLGIKPTHASTGYGYIQKYHDEIEPGVYAVKQYIEKPYLELAKSFIRNGDFLWNSGIFMWKMRDVLKAYEQFLPSIFGLFNDAVYAMNTTAEKEQIQFVYSQCENISIDFGILEKSGNVFIIPSSLEWSDLGTWKSAWENMAKDFQSNAVTGKNVIVIDSSKCLVHTSTEKIVVIQGLDDFIVADTKEGLLICRKEKEEDIKNYMAEMKGASQIFAPLSPRQ